MDYSSRLPLSQVLALSGTWGLILFQKESLYSPHRSGGCMGGTDIQGHLWLVPRGLPSFLVPKECPVSSVAMTEKGLQGHSQPHTVSARRRSSAPLAYVVWTSLNPGNHSNVRLGLKLHLKHLLLTLTHLHPGPGERAVGARTPPHAWAAGGTRLQGLVVCDKFQ